MQADRKQMEALLKTARGQIDGILKMVEEDRYCVDISNQLMATTSILKKANVQIIDAHIRGCVRQAILENDPEERLDEVTALLQKIAKNS